MIKAGIGYSRDQDSFNSGVMATKIAIEENGIEEANLVIAFCTKGVDCNSFYSGVRSVVGEDVDIVGGSAVGIITNNNLSCDAFSSAVACIESDTVDFDVEYVNKLKDDEFLAGKNLGEKIDSNLMTKLMLLFYDSIKSPPTESSPPVLNASAPIINGIESVVGSDTPIFGAGLVGDFGLGSISQYCKDCVSDNSIVATRFSGKMDFYSTIMHGCTPKDGIYHTITDMSGQFVYEVDGKPIVEMINDFYGNDSWQQQNPVWALTIGVNYGDKFSTYCEGNYVNRLISGVLPDKSGIVLFEADLEVGTEFQFMLRDNIRIVDATKVETEKLVNEIYGNGKNPVFALYIDCAGRSSNYSITLTDEASEVQNILNKYRIPLLGFYSGVEIAPLIGNARGLDWTGVLLIITEE